MNILKYIFVALAYFVVQNTTAQQDPHRTFYNYQMNLINPAYAGAEDHVDVTLSIRSQWANIEGSPESQSIIASAPLGKNLGLGISVQNDKTFIEKQTSIAIDLGYKITLNENYNLFFGLKAGGNSFNINSQGLITYSVMQDGSLMDFNSRFTPNIGVGAYLKHNKFYFSLSVPNMLSTDRLEEENGVATLSDGKQHYYASVGYNFMLNSTIDLQISSLYRYVGAAPSSLDFTGILDFGKRFNIGASYRTNSAVAGMLLFNVSDSFTIGYAYETATNNEISGLDNASHEVLMKLQL